MKEASILTAVYFVGSFWELCSNQKTNPEVSKSAKSNIETKLIFLATYHEAAHEKRKPRLAVPSCHGRVCMVRLNTPD